MNFLKISGLFLGASSFVGGTGAGIYYGVIKNNSEEDDKKSEEKLNAKTEFVGKLVFEKKLESNYEMKLLSQKEYAAVSSEFDEGKNEGSKYLDINKIVDISHSLNVENTKTELGKIFAKPLTLASIKLIISSKENELKGLFSDDIYSNLKSKLGVAS